MKTICVLSEAEILDIVKIHLKESAPWFKIGTVQFGGPKEIQVEKDEAFISLESVKRNEIVDAARDAAAIYNKHGVNAASFTVAIEALMTTVSDAGLSLMVEPQ